MASSDYELNSEHYVFLNCIGEGDFGEVWKCLKIPTSKCVAVKIPTYVMDSEFEVRLFIHCLFERLSRSKVVSKALYIAIQILMQYIYSVL